MAESPSEGLQVRDAAALSRHGTLLSSGASPIRRAAELKSLLGNANSRLPPGASITHHSREPTHLEHAKPRARVEVDIMLHSNVCVEGSTPLKGLVKIRVRPRLPKESAISISDGKLRIIGFETTEGDHHEFYQCSAPLSAVVTSPSFIFETSSLPDPEGFSRAREGVHRLEFEMHVPFQNRRPKGPLHGHAGVAVRYIALISIKVKDEFDKRSIAHFYRDCEVWPRLNPSVILTPATGHSPRATTSQALFMGGSGEVTLTAGLHRSVFVAGTRVAVHVTIHNGSKKLIKRLTLSLLRSIIVFKRKPEAPWQSNTSRKSVATSTLEMAQGFPRGHASSNGWWAGVPSGGQSGFCHFLPIPPDALTHTRERLVEVVYEVSVSVTAGVTSSDVSVTLPLQIVNFISLDPPLILNMSSPIEPSLQMENRADCYEFDFDSDDYSNDGSFEPQYDDGQQAYEMKAELGNLSICEDAEDLVHHAVMSAQSDTCSQDSQWAEDDFQDAGHPSEEIVVQEGVHREEVKASRPDRACGPSSFATRVQQKLQAVSKSRRQSLVSSNPESCEETELEATGDPVAEAPPDVPSKSTILCDSAYQVASSSFLNDCYFTPRAPAAASGLLPKTSSIVGLPFHEPADLATAIFVSIPPLTSPGTASLESDLSETSDSSAVSEDNSRRPSLAPGPPSSLSVKDKIKELEERVRLAEGY